MNRQLAILSYLDLVLQNAHLISEENRARLVELARRDLLSADVIRKLQKAGIRVPFPDHSRSVLSA
jgi:hypothetical protein